MFQSVLAEDFWPKDAKVYFIQPSNNETITGPVTVKFGLLGLGVAPAGVVHVKTGHHHLLIDVSAPAGAAYKNRFRLMGASTFRWRPGVTEQQWRVLRVLIDHGANDVSALASAALLRPPSLTRILRELSSRGLVSRKVDSEDARRVIVTITPSGRRLVDLTTHTTLMLLDRYDAAFGFERLRSLLNELALLTETFSGPGGIEAAD